MVTLSLMAAVLVASAAAAAPGGAGPEGPVTVEIVASGHVETPADRFRVSGNVLACAATQPEADALLTQKLAAIETTMRGMGVTRARAQERPSFAGMIGAMSSLRGARDCNRMDMKDMLAGAGAAKPKDAPVEQVGASAPVAFDAPSPTVAGRAIVALKAADAKPSDKSVPILFDDTPARRAAKQQALAKAKQEADAYGAPLGLHRATLTRISEKQDWNSVDFVGQMVRTMGLAATAPSDTVATDVTLTVEFRLGG